MADAEMRFGADASEVVNAYDKMVEGERKYEGSVRTTARAIARRENEMQQGMLRAQQQMKEMETQGTISIKSLISEWKALETAIKAATAAGENAYKQQTAHAERKQQEVNQLGKLAELAALDKDPDASLKKMFEQVDQLRKTGVTESRGAAADLVFQFKSLGIKEKDQDMIAGLLKFGVLPEAPEVAKSASVFQSALGGEKKAGTLKQIFSQGFAASSEAPTQFQNIMQQAGLAAPGAQLAKMPQEELLAGMGVLTKTTGSAEEARTLMDQLTKIMVKRGLAGAPLEHVVKEINEQNLSGIQKQELFGGRLQSLKAFELLSGNMDMFRDLRTKTYEATNEDLATKAIGVASRNPNLYAGVAKREGEGHAEISDQERANERALAMGRSAWLDNGTWMGGLAAWGSRYTGYLTNTPGLEADTPWGSIRDQQIKRLEASAGAPEVGPAVAAPNQPYKPRGFIVPSVPNDQDPEYVRVQAEKAKFELAKFEREEELRGTKFTHGTPGDDRGVRMDKVVRQNTAAIEKLEATLKGMEAKKRINMGAALQPN